MQLVKIIAVLTCIMVKDAAHASSRLSITPPVMVTEQATLPIILPDGHLRCPKDGDALYFNNRSSSVRTLTGYAFFCCNHATALSGLHHYVGVDPSRPPYSCTYDASHRHPEPPAPHPAPTDGEWVDPPPP